jgi:hypothetical protein
MKIKMLIPALLSIIIVGAVSMGCESSSEKIQDANEKLRDANKNLATLKRESREEAHRLKMEKEWQQYKSECEMTIAENDVKIAELEKAILENKKGYNTEYITKVNELKGENNMLRERIRDYEINSNMSAWEDFKYEVGKDMQDISDAFKNLTI